jgi:hypothetical protein
MFAPINKMCNQNDQIIELENREVLFRGKKLYYCQEWDLNPCPFGPVPETGALDQLGHLD